MSDEPKPFLEWTALNNPEGWARIHYYGPRPDFLQVLTQLGVHVMVKGEPDEHSPDQAPANNLGGKDE